MEIEIYSKKQMQRMIKEEVSKYVEQLHEFMGRIEKRIYKIEEEIRTLKLE